ncbi:MAG: heme ABC exporter ATP-binding protein CcmA, partial [Robiginitomaculum sp.]|nr:heme ABC exporter ATP-binding protein CcmA [Robiginitomaculum sp.]
MIEYAQNSNVLEIKYLSIDRGNAVLFQGLNLTLNPGDMVWVKGNNGIGKTSLLKCCAGLLRASSGDVFWNGKDITKQEMGYAAFLGHHDAHKPSLTPTETLEFWRSLYDNDTPKEIELCLKRVALWERRNQSVKTLSAGQSRRLSLARIYMSNAPLWILDEPSAAMDEQGRKLIGSLLKEHIASKGSVLLASHGAP